MEIKELYKDLYDSDQRILIQLDNENKEVHIKVVHKMKLEKIEAECNNDNIVLGFKDEDMITIISFN